jgi:integrase
LGDAERELEREVWRMGILRPDGGHNRIDYRPITQAWLREAARQWNLQRLVSRSVDTLRESVHAAAALSMVLGLREGRGEDPGALRRQDAVDFLMHMRARELSGELSSQRHHQLVCSIRALLRETRERGLHRQVGPLRGLADEFSFYDSDVPRAAARDPEGEPERALPQTVIDQLLAPDALALLRDTVGEALACALELQMRSGRRPQEIAHAPFNCLEHEQRVREDGSLESLPVFVYRPEKRPKTRKELPIFGEERRLIKRMQALARERFPDADPDRLPLVPRRMANRDGLKPIRPTMLPLKMRQWTRAIGELTGPDGEPFDRTKLFPYAFRHSYAQRLADQGASEGADGPDGSRLVRDHARLLPDPRRAPPTRRRARRQGAIRQSGASADARTRAAGRGGADKDGTGLAGRAIRRVRGAGQRRLDGRRVQVHAQVPGMQALQNRPLAPARA